MDTHVNSPNIVGRLLIRFELIFSQLLPAMMSMGIVDSISKLFRMSVTYFLKGVGLFGL